MSSYSSLFESLNLQQYATKTQYLFKEVVDHKHYYTNSSPTIPGFIQSHAENAKNGGLYKSQNLYIQPSGLLSVHVTIFLNIRIIAHMVVGMTIPHIAHGG